MPIALIFLAFIGLGNGRRDLLIGWIVAERFSVIRMRDERPVRANGPTSHTRTATRDCYFSVSASLLGRLIGPPIFSVFGSLTSYRVAISVDRKAVFMRTDAASNVIATECAQPPRTDGIVRFSGTEGPAENSITRERFVALTVRYERRVRLFVSTLHPTPSDVDEILQDAWRGSHGGM
jgi:hypothetical protein